VFGGVTDLVQRYADRILGVLSCYDRVIVRGRIHPLDYPSGMESYLRAQGIRFFDLPKFAMPFREAIRENAERVAWENSIEVQFIRNHEVRNSTVRRFCLAVDSGESPIIPIRYGVMTAIGANSRARCPIDRSIAG